MADNINVTPSGSTPVATDDIGGIQYQRTKLVWGVDGVAVDASANNPLPVANQLAATLFKGRSSSFRMPGRAGTAGQKLFSIFNGVGSTITVLVNRIFCDLYQTAAKAVSVPPPIIRVYKITTAPTNGTLLTKNKIGGITTSSASVEVRGDSSADGTGSAATLTITTTAGTHITQEFAPRLITAAGYEVADRLEFFGDTQVELNAGEGLVVALDYTAANQNPTTDQWISGIDWEEN